MYMVYWTHIEDGRSTARAEQFGTEDMAGAMQWMEALRTRQRAGEPISFIAMASEHPDSVGLPGVAEAGADYRWKKRRR
jgi:hypothetical protein